MSMRIIPTRARFAEGQEPSFIVKGTTKQLLQLSLFRENRLVWHGIRQINEKGMICLNGLSLKSHSGYLLQVDNSDAQTETAFDISTDQVRYGFLTDFSRANADDTAPVEWLNRLHITDVQFYDWAYRHDQLIGPTNDYTDMMGKSISRVTLHTLIGMCHEYGINAVAYGAIYGASHQYAKKHPDECLYDSKGNPVFFFDLLSIMNVERGCAWHDHILSEYQKALDLGFDGIHMDTYGFPEKANDVHGCKLDLARDFRELVNDAKSSLHTSTGAPKLIFNNVKNWPVDYLASAHQDALYIEVWDPYSTYADILRLIEHARSISDLPVILAAYLPQFIQGSSQKAYNALEILTAIITVAGATHLINGQNRGLLTQAYYSKYFTADAKHAERIVTYYDYITYLSGLWDDRGLHTAAVASERAGGRNIIAGEDILSDLPKPGRIWARVQGKNDFLFINFVNLMGSRDPKWTHNQNVRQTKPFTFRVRTDKPASSVTYSTPDGEQGIDIRNLEFITQKHGDALYTCIQIPSMYIWGTVIIRL